MSRLERSKRKADHKDMSRHTAHITMVISLLTSLMRINHTRSVQLALTKPVQRCFNNVEGPDWGKVCREQHS